MVVSYNWLKEYLGNDVPTPEKIAELLTFHSFEIESVKSVGDDVAIDIKILPDRGSDCLSIRGVAREVASILNVSLISDPLREAPVLKTTNLIAVTIADTESCPRFTASLMTGISVGESPQWLKDRLATLGARSINNIVDATNYVMYALGQPLHAYDADKFPKVDGRWQFVVRPAGAGEVVALLAEGGKVGDRDVTLKGGELLIVDGSRNQPIGLAGVKGGRFAGVDETTTKIIIEAAHFNPTLTRKTARRHGIVIDASKRFENEPARALPPYAQAEISKLIADIAGGTFEGYLDVYPLPKVPPTVPVNPAVVNARLGLALTISEIVSLLKRVGVTVVIDEEVLLCTGPMERTDLTIAENFIDEVGRIYGYHHVVSVAPTAMPLSQCNARHYYAEKIRQLLIAQGFYEVITSSFRNQDEIQLQNALASDKSYVRSTLIKNIAEVLDKNVGFQDWLGTNDIRVFEIGTVFHKAGGTVTEHTALCFGVRLKQSGYSGKEDKIIIDVCTQLETTLQTVMKRSLESGVAEVNLTELIADLPAPTSYEPVPTSVEIIYQPVSVYPSVSRDIAMWVKEGTAVDGVAATLCTSAGPFLVRLTHTDTFTKDARTSFAFRLVFQSNEKTLTDKEVNEYMGAVYSSASAAGWETR